VFSIAPQKLRFAKLAFNYETPSSSFILTQLNAKVKVYPKNTHKGLHISIDTKILNKSIDTKLQILNKVEKQSNINFV